MQYEVGVDDCEIRPDSSAILFRCTDGTARLYDIPQPMPDNPKLIHAWALAHSGFQVGRHVRTAAIVAGRVVGRAERIEDAREVRQRRCVTLVQVLRATSLPDRGTR